MPSIQFYVTIGLLASWLGFVALSAGLNLRDLDREVERLEKSLEEAADDAHRRLTAIAHRVDRLEGAPCPEVPGLPGVPEWGMTAVPPSGERPI